MGKRNNRDQRGGRHGGRSGNASKPGEGMQLRLPSDSRQLLQHRWKDCEHFGLRFEKLIHFRGYEAKLQVDSRSKINNPETFNFRQHYGRFLSNLKTKQSRLASEMFTDRAVFGLKLGERMAMGMGEAHVYENGLRLHHTYGLPYIPGSSLKGAARAMLLGNCFGLDAEAEKEALTNPCFLALFGGENSRQGAKSESGQVAFLDAFPISLPAIEVEVLNAHYGEYYGEAKAPADWLKVNPVFFASLAAGIQFRFHLGSQRQVQLDTLEGWERIAPGAAWQEKTLAALGAYWLKEALTSAGIGAKTALSYGIFDE